MPFVRCLLAGLGLLAGRGTGLPVFLRGEAGLGGSPSPEFKEEDPPPYHTCSRKITNKMVSKLLLMEVFENEADRSRK